MGAAAHRSGRSPLNSRHRVSAALIALLALVLGVWLAQHALSGQRAPDRPAVVSVNP